MQSAIVGAQQIFSRIVYKYTTDLLGKSIYDGRSEVVAFACLKQTHSAFSDVSLCFSAMSTITATMQSSPAPTSYQYLSPSCQQIVTESFVSISSTKVIVRSNFSDPKLFPTISQHKCNGVALTPAGSYTDMADTVAKYICRKFRGADLDISDVGVNVYEMEVHKPFIAKIPQPAEGQWVEMEVALQIPAVVTERLNTDVEAALIKCFFRSVKPDGTKIQDHGHCLARFESTSAWLKLWVPHTSLITTQIANLETRALAERSGNIDLVHRRKAYNLFQSFVDYGPKYQNMSEVIFDKTTLEATAKLDFQPDPAKDCLGPFYMDGSCHLSGFVCNAVEQDAAKNAYVSHGISGMKLSSKFKPMPGADIRSYVRMEQLASDKSVIQGNVWVVQDGEIVGLWEGVRFKQIPRRVLNIFLPPRKKVRMEL